MPALVTRTASASPRWLIWCANIFSAIGERQMFPEQMKVMCKRASDISEISAISALSDTEYLA
ncbi:hypothetical protein MAGR_66130 [Mycolicibacterium agri]|uniref:Uncharacterized protein n=1 Tax=Mycolicibacterium agri TaxID=36811 RepID=A0A7I9WBR4_MYCAG|nr:hypothetical protein MAGR_66130 [Mycolicibacterium agri]